MKYYYVRPGASVTVVKNISGKGSSYTSERLTKNMIFELTALASYDAENSMFVFKIGNLMFYVNSDDVDGIS